MITKTTAQRCFPLILGVILAACQFQTEVPGSTSTVVPVTQTLTTGPSETPSSTQLPSLPLDDLRIIYVINGNIYLQDGNSPALQLTFSGEDDSPVISDDGQKVIFYRGNSFDGGASFDNIYSINSDGSDEKSITIDGILSKEGLKTKKKSLAFVPGTHKIIINTFLCNETSDTDHDCMLGLALIDIDTEEFDEILKPSGNLHISDGHDSWPWGGNFKVSPNGEWVSVSYSGSVDIFNIVDKTIYRKVTTYTRSAPDELFPQQFWKTDSSSLLLALPNESNFGPTNKTSNLEFTVWHYTLENSHLNQIPVENLPVLSYINCGNVLNPSPDISWLLYNGSAEGTSLYLGNLSHGRFSVYNPSAQCAQVHWSKDNMHFVYAGGGGTHLGSIEKTEYSIDGGFLGWINPTHYLYYDRDDREHVLVGEITEKGIINYDSDIVLPEGFTWLTFVSAK
jgi:hypothetical protein